VSCDPADREHHLVRVRGVVAGDQLRHRGVLLLHPHHHDSVRRRIAAYRHVHAVAVGRVAVPKANKGAGSAVGNVIWFVIAGWWLTLVHIVSGTLLCLTIIGIPLGLANFKLITVGLRPFGREIVSVEEATRRTGGQPIAVPALGSGGEVRSRHG
jgi:hypothetical protein